MYHVDSSTFITIKTIIFAGKCCIIEDFFGDDYKWGGANVDHSTITVTGKSN
jgi:hypothetical protein